MALRPLPALCFQLSPPVGSRLLSLLTFQQEGGSKSLWLSCSLLLRLGEGTPFFAATRTQAVFRYPSCSLHCNGAPVVFQRCANHLGLKSNDLKVFVPTERKRDALPNDFCFAKLGICQHRAAGSKNLKNHVIQPFQCCSVLALVSLDMIPADFIKCGSDLDTARRDGWWLTPSAGA